MPRSATTQMRPTPSRAPQLVDDRQKGGDIGGVAGPQLAAQRPAVLIHDQPDDHLVEIRAVVLRVAAPAKLGAALSLEGQAGGVHEDHAEFARTGRAGGRNRLPLPRGPCGSVASVNALAAVADRRARCAEPSHGAVVMMQLKGIGAVDPVIGAPLIRRAVRAPTQTVGGAPSRTPRARRQTRNCRSAASSANTARQPTSCHSRSKSSAGPIRRHRASGAASSSTSDSTIERCASRATERARRSRSPRATTTSLRPRLAMMRLLWCDRSRGRSRPGRRRCRGQCACRGRTCP